MFQCKSQPWMWSLLATTALLSAGCSTLSGGKYACGNGCCDPGMGCGQDGCGDCGKAKRNWLKFGKKEDCGSCESCVGDQQKSFGKCGGCGKGGCLTDGCCGHCWAHRSLAIPDQYPIGAVMRSHFHQMQTNGEAMDFIFFQKDFVLESAELTPDGKDKVLEIAARMRSAPFPVIVERTWNNADPELDAHRRAIIAQILADHGNSDANNRTFVAPSYGPGKHSLEGASEFYQFTFMGSNNNNNNFGGGNGGGFGGGAGGGAGGGF